MNKLDEGTGPILCDLIEKVVKIRKEVNGTQDGTTCEKEEKNSRNEEDERKEILKFTMLINKYNYDLDKKTDSQNGEDQERCKRDIKCTMFFNKEVTIRPNAENCSHLIVNSQEPVKFVRADPNPAPTKFDEKFSIQNLNELSKIRVSKPYKFSNYSIYKKTEFENDCVRLAVHPDLRIHNSLSAFSKNIKLEVKGIGKSNFPSLTAINSNSTIEKSRSSKFNRSTLSENAVAVKMDEDKCLIHQMSKSSDGKESTTIRYKNEYAVSVSDSKLLINDTENKKHIQKYDKKSRGDSTKKDKEASCRKQVQWKTEVDVIYFSSQSAANGDRRGEIIGRVMEPLREEWEQQRRGFYAKMLSYHIESHLKDRFISLLKI